MEHMEIWDINDGEFKIAVLKILNEMWENTTGNLMHSENKSANKTCTFPRHWTLKKKQINSGDIKINKRDQEWISKH